MEEYARAIPAELCPIYLEPVFGSGERWTVAVAIITPEACKVINTVPPTLSRCLGSLGAGLHTAAGEIAADLKRHMSAGKKIREWQPLFDGCEVGESMSAAADNMEQAVSIAISSLASLMAKQINEGADEAAIEPFGNREWLANIREATVERNPKFRGFFGRKAAVHYRDVTLEYQFGFLGGRLAANFTCILPQSISYSRGAAESDLFRLEQLRSHQQASDLLTLQHFEMMAYTPRSKDMSTTDQRRVRSALDGLEAFADSHSLRLRIFHDASQAADRLVQAEGA